MKSKLLILFLLCSFFAFGQSVPNTTTFNLQNVVDAVKFHTPATTSDLVSCFANSIAGYFNPTYGSKTMNPQTMYGFRDYKICVQITSGVYYHSSSSTSWCATPTASGFILRGTTTNIYTTTTLYAGADCTTFADAGWYGVWTGGGSNWRYWNGSSFTASGTCPLLVPTVTTASITNIEPTTATGGGNVTSDGGAVVTSRGVCWSTSQNPTIADSHYWSGNGTGSFVSYLAGLSSCTLYYVRAYAINSVGTAYGDQVRFTTL